MKRVIVTVAAIASFSVALTSTGIAGPLDVNVQISGYLPAPPGVRIHVESDRPYYVENNRRVYLEKKPKHDRGKHLGWDKEGNGNQGKGKKGKHD